MLHSISYSRLNLSTLISRCNSPIPLMIVCPVSSSTLTINVGSSAASLLRQSANLSKSSWVFGSIARLITGSGKWMFSNTIGWSIEHKVSPVRISLNPTNAPISPASMNSSGFCLLACICIILEIRSFFPVLLLRTWTPDLTLPEYTRKKAIFPTNGSAAILNANDANASSVSGLRVSSFSV